jgi:hypothetical protein
MFMRDYYTYISYYKHQTNINAPFLHYHFIYPICMEHMAHGIILEDVIFYYNYLEYQKMIKEQFWT